MNDDSAASIAAWVRHLQAVSALPLQPDTPPPAAALRAPKPGATGLDVTLWTVAGLTADRPALPLELAADGPLHPWQGEGAIEVWTDVELSGLHAAWRIARRDQDAALRARLLRAMDWHLEHTQPDNATNRPWALHAFLLKGSADARAYAGTLLHNAVALGVCPEPLSAWILMDAAAELRIAHEASAGR